MRPATIIKLIVLAIFVTVGPTLLLWTAGYRWNPRSGKIEATGILVIDSEPAGASISIGEENIHTITPARLTALLPRSYTVTVEKTGYRRWQGTSKVDGGKTAFLTRVRLFPENSPELLLERAVKKLALSADEATLAAAIKTESGGEIWAINAANGEKKLLAEFPDEEIEKIDWSPAGKNLLAVSRNPTGLRAAIISEGKNVKLNPPEGALADINWSGSDPNRLLLTTIDRKGVRSLWLLPAQVSQATLLARLSSSKYLAAAPVGILEENVLTVAEARATSTEVWARTAGDVKTKTPLLILPDGPYAFRPAPSPYLLLANLNRERLLLIDRERREVLEEIPATAALWNKENRRELLYWDDVELGLGEAGKERITVTRLAEGIKKAAWLPGGTHVLLLGKNKLLAIERLPQGEGRSTTELLALTEAADFALAGESAFVAGAVGEKIGLWRVRLK
ncbi:PEGA domain-containing protein [Patescibacteria group bacterium]|nr:MAG: PEGA domain-containing protein [Patescibacteria group bacterium]